MTKKQIKEKASCVLDKCKGLGSKIHSSIHSVTLVRWLELSLVGGLVVWLYKKLTNKK